MTPIAAPDEKGSPHTKAIPPTPAQEWAEKPVLVISSEKLSSLVEADRYHTAVDQGNMY